MEIKYLKTFKTILEQGSFQKAAHYLNYAQSTITFQVQQLENELDVKLFEKIGRKMVLTKAGHDLLPYIDSILQSVSYLENYSTSKQELSGTLCVGIPETLLTYQMQPVLKRFKACAPQVKLTLRVLNCYEIREQLTTGAIDLGIHYDVGGYEELLICERLADYKLALIANLETDDEIGDFLKKNQRKELCLLTNDTNSIYQKMLERYLGEKEIILDSQMDIGSMEAIKQSVESNLGIAYVPRFVVKDELEAGRIKQLVTELDHEVITAVCMYHKNKWLTPAMKCFIDLLKEQIY